MMIDKLIEATKAKHRDEPIHEEDYAAWRANPVTVRLMEELETACMESYADQANGSTLEEIAIESVVTQSVIETSSIVINWKPQELMTDED